MKKLRKRVFSLLLACVMVFSLLPATAWAYDFNEEPGWAKTAIADLAEHTSRNYSFSGTTAVTGTSLAMTTYIYSYQDTNGHMATGSVVVFGVDPSANGSTEIPANNTTWAGVNGISAICITEGVTGIGDGAFAFASNRNLGALEDVYIADSVTRIGANAFSGNGGTHFNGTGPNNSLDLSHVQLGDGAFQNCAGLSYVNLTLSGKYDIGANVFNGCGLGSVTFTDEEGMKTIGEGAFAGNHLARIAVPEGVTEIGDDAFSGNTLSSITLPDSLISIGDRAFYTATANNSLTSLTIPANVTSIGSAAFQSYKELETITVEGSGAIAIGSAAFGDSKDNAYSKDGETLTLTKRDGTTEEVTLDLGATILTRSEEAAGSFDNGVNCYTGDIVSYVYSEADSVLPTCTIPGKEVYILTIQDRDDEYLYTIDRTELGHDWGKLTKYGPTCEKNERYAQKCTRCDAEEANSVVDVEGGEKARSHEYHLTQMYSSDPETMDTNFEEGKTLQVVYSCIHDEHATPPDTYEKWYDYKVPGTTIRFDATTELGDVSEGTLTLNDQFRLSWNYGAIETSILNEGGSAGEESTLKAGEYEIPVVLLETATQTYLPDEGAIYTEDGSGEKLTVTVVVETVPLDLSDTVISNTERYEGRSQAAAEASGYPTAGVTYRGLEFRAKNGGNTWTSAVPSQDEAGEYEVRAVFEYDSDIYHIDTKLCGEGYTVEKGPDDEDMVYLIHDYTITEYSTASIAVQPLNPIYDSGPVDVFSVTDVPAGAVITYTISKKTTAGSWETVVSDKEYSVPADGDAIVSVSFGKEDSLKEAGSYKLDITVDVEKAGFEGEPVKASGEGSIHRKPIAPPTPASDLYYNGSKQTGVSVPKEFAGIYTISDNTETDAGTYTATATFINNNYQWQTGDPDTASITWTIRERSLNTPTVRGSLTYNKTPLDLLNRTNTSDYIVLYVDNQDGTQTAYAYHEAVAPTNVQDGQIVEQSEIDGAPNWAMRLSPAKATDVGTYTITLTLWDKNYELNNKTGLTEKAGAAGGYQDYEFATKSVIKKADINPKPQISVSNYSYQGTAITLDQIKIDTAGCNTDIFDVEHVSYQFYRGIDADGTKIDRSEVVNQGSYYVEVTFTGEEAENYDTTIEAGFRIIPAQLTMVAPPAQEKTYTVAGVALQVPTVRGVVDNPVPDGLYTLTYTYQYSPSKVENWEDIKEETIEPSATLRDVGDYRVTVSMTVPSSGNYEAATAVQYELHIAPADQKVHLSSGDNAWNAEQRTITKTLGDEPFSVTGKGYVGESETDAAISYQSSADTVASVDSDGKVTLHRATGDTPVTITVTAAAEEGNNYRLGQNTYTLTVNKATPSIDMSGYKDGKLKTPYADGVIENYQLARLIGAGNDAVGPNGGLTYTFYEDEDCKDLVDNGLTGGTNTNTPIDVGTYYLKVTYDGENDPNYTNASAAQTITVTITPADVTDVTVTDYEDTYDGETHNMSEVKVTVPESFEEGSYTVQFAESVTQPDADEGTDVWKNASEITFRNVSDSTNENTGVHYWYMVTFDGDNYAPVIDEVNVTINPATLTLSSTLPDKKQLTRPYDGTVELPTGQRPMLQEPTGLVEGDGEITVTAEYADKDAWDSKDVVVTYTITFADGMEDNYTVSDGLTREESSTDSQWVYTETKIGAGKITQKEIAVTGGISAEDRVYDGRAEVALSGTPQEEEEAFVEDDDVSFLAITNETGTAANSGVGTWNFTVTAETLKSLLEGEDADNYTVSADYTGATVTISERPVYLLFPGQTYGEGWEAEVPYSTGGLLSQSDRYEVHAQDAGEDSGFVDIDHVRLEEGDIDYTFSDSSGGVSNPTNLGTYTVTAALSDTVGDKFSNYNIDAVTGTIEIVANGEALKVEIEWDEALVYTGQGLAPIESIKVLGGSEKLTEGAGGYTIAFSLENDSTYEITSEDDLEDAIVNAGTYTIYWQVTTTNYGTTTGNRKITVDRAELALTSSVTTTKTYDGTNDTEGQVTLGANALTGQQNGEQIEVSITSAVYDDATADNDKRITITYALEAAEGVLDNYKVSINGEEAVDAAATMPETVDATITPALVTVTISDQTAVYDGETPEVSEVKEGNWKLTQGEIYQLTSGTDDDLGITLSIPRDAKDAGTYAISGDWENTNYDVTFVGSWEGDNDRGKAGTFTIELRRVKVTIGNTSGVYGDDHGAAVDSSSTLLTAEEPNVEQDRGLAPGESLEDIGGILLDTDANAESGVSSYSIYAVTASGEKITGETQYGNYMVTFVNGNATFTVHRRPITITIANKESAYGCTRQDLTWEDSYTGDSSKDGIVNDDDLGIDLTTTASSTSDVDDYPITGTTTAGSDVTGNYDITWAGSWNGEDDKKGIAGTYTIEQADVSLDIQEDTLQVGFGESRQINISFTNKSSSNVIDDEDDIAALMDALQFSGGSGYTIDVQDGTVTVTVTDNNVLLRVDATLEETTNFHANTEGDGFVLIGVQGQLNVQVFPVQGLSYTGEDLALVYPYYGDEELPEGVTIQYTQDQTDEASWSENIPTGKNADQYTVYWRIYDPTGTYAGSGVVHTVFSSIAKANLTAEFQSPTDDVLLSAGTYDIAAKNPLALLPDTGYGRNQITYTSSDPSVVGVGSDGTLTLNGVGSAMITARIPEDGNHYGTTAVFTLYVNNENSMRASADDVSGAYDGVASYSINVTVENAPDDSTPEIRYYGVKHEAGEAPVPPATEHYSEENPSFTEAGTYTVFFYVTAAGANPVQGSAQITISPRTIRGTYAENYSGEGMVSQIAAGEFIYSGGEIRPAVAVWDTISGKAKQLVEGTDYEVIYTDNVQIGTGAVTVRGIGNYDGEVKQEFSIIEVPGKQLTAELDRYYGLLDDPETTSATVSVRHGDHSIDAAYISISVVGPNGDSSGCTVEGLELSFSVSGVYKITVEVDDGSHAGTMTLYYALMPKTSDGGFRMTLDGSSTKVVTFGQRLIAEDSGIAEQITVTDGEDSLTYGQDYILSCTWYDYHGNQKSVEFSALTGIPQAGMYVVTAKGIGQYSGTGTFTFLVLQKNLSDGDIQWTVEGNLIYDAAAQTPQVTGGQFTDAAGTLQKVDFVVDTSVGENGYQNNINAGEGTARVAVKAPDNSNNYTGTALLPFSIGRRPITEDEDFTITVPAKVHISAGGEARPAVTIYDEELGRPLTNQDFKVTYRDNGTAGTATVVIEGTGNYCTTAPIEKSFTVVVTSTTFDLAIDKTSWTYRDEKAASITVTGGGAQLDIKQGHYVLSISKGNEDPQEFDDTGAALAYLDEPGTYTVTAIGRGSYSFTDTETVVISKARLALEITVTPNTKAGRGTATIQVTPGAGWPYASTSLRTLTVTKNGAAQDALTLEYDTTANAYQPVSFSFGNETATYRFGISTAEITDFDEDCYELAITGGLLTVVEQTNTGGGGGGGGGGTTTTYTISAEAGTGGTINPNGDVQVTRGADYTFTISASEGYAIDDVIVDGASVGAVSRYTFENVREDHTIEAVFVRDNGVADPDETGVSNWLNTVDHFAYLSGYPGDLFGPDNNMTRAEAAQMFYNLLLDKDVPTTVTFMDVDSDTWYADAVHALASLGIINGVGDNRYEPERAITRAEFTVMATRFAHVQTAGVDTFSDVSESDWFFPYVATCVQYGWIDGYPDGTFRPDNSITRSEVTTIVNRMLGRSADSAYVDDHTGDLTQFNDVEPMHWAYYQIMEAANAHDYIKSGGMEDWTGLN